MAQRRSRPTREPQAPPQDIHAEEHVLGALLLGGKTLERVQPILQASDFYRHSHALIYQAIVRLHEQAIPADPITVHDELDRAGHLEDAGGRVRLFELATIVPAAGNAPHYARIIHDRARERHAIAAFQNATQRIWTRETDLDNVLRTVHEQLAAQPATATDHSWIATSLDGPDPEPHEPPALAGLVYDGEHHLVMAEPESMKSWLFLQACLENARRGQASVYIDAGEMNERDVRERLAALGATDQERSLIRYIQPQDPLAGHAARYLRSLIQEHHVSLVCIDALAGLLRLHGLDENLNKDVTDLFMSVYIGTLTDGLDHAPATLTADHVVKNKEARGRWASGAHAKLDRWRVGLQLETLLPLTRSQDGLARVTVSKDRPARLQRPTAGKIAFKHHANVIRYQLEPADKDSDQVGIRETWMRRISDTLALSRQDMNQREIIAAVTKSDGSTGSREHKIAALNELVDLGYVTETKVGKSIFYRLDRQFPGFADDPR